MSSVKVSYKVCIEKKLKDSLVSFPSTLAQAESTPVQVICMANSGQIVPGNLSVLCDSDGEWNTSRLQSRCVCKKNLENIDGVCTGMAILATNESLAVVLLLVVITFLSILDMIYHMT